MRYNGEISNKRRFDNGLPQGSVLAPLLWLCYVNDLPACIPGDTQLGNSKYLFADDLAIHTYGKTLQECEKKMEDALKGLEQWSKANKVTISICDSPK